MKTLALLLLAPLAFAAESTRPAPPAPGETIALIGNGLGERMLDHPWLETELHLRFPDHELVVRNLAKPGDTPGFRPRAGRKSPWAFPGAERFHPHHRIHRGQGRRPAPDEWLASIQADTILAFFGYNESFEGEAGLERFRGELAAFVKHTLAQRYNGESAPRLVLVSPVPYEGDAAGRWQLPDGEAENERLAAYTELMREVAADTGVAFVDLFSLGDRLPAPFTRNGFLPNDAGYRVIGRHLADALYGPAPRESPADPETLADLIRDKNWQWFHDYRIFNGVHSEGRRYEPFGPQNYPAERRKARALAEVRDRAIHALVQGREFDLTAADAATPELPPVPTNYGLKRMQPGAQGSSDTPQARYLDGDDATDALNVPAGFEISQFASEKEFPNLANPVQLSFDARGRLWVAVMPTYPHWRPGDPRPDDKLLIYEDTDGDGRADRETVFADGLHLPLGFELAAEGVWVSQAPHLMLLRDTDNDDRADTREIVLTGFDTHDSHHSIGAFCSDPTGAIVMAEGLFLHSNVETPYGPIRGVDGGFYRFDPRRLHLERLAQLPIPNPWGIAFDKWGQDFFLHTSGPPLNWMLPGSIRAPHGEKNPTGPDLVPRAHRVRPTSGLEFLSSRHFPDPMQGDLLLCNNIGFLGIKQHAVRDDGAGYQLEHRQDLLVVADKNVRPVDLEVAPDGSLMVVDWHNVLVGHMQHNARDPLRDHVHGRLYRITHKQRPLLEPAAIAGAPIDTLLENLKLPELRSRDRSRRELRGRPTDEVLPAARAFADRHDDPHLKLEALWVTAGHDAPNRELLDELLQSPDFHARAGAVRVARHFRHQFDDLTAILRRALGDAHPRVRLEGLVAATWLDPEQARPLVEQALTLPNDRWIDEPRRAAAARLGIEGIEAPEENPAPAPPKHLADEDRARFFRGHEIYHREGHCVTCHQPDGHGLPDAGFPPIAGTDWTQGDPEVLIKLTLHGLIGPIEVKGRQYPGQVPMTPFGGLLDDEEVAAVLTYVRNHFGNKASAITPAQVAKVREATGTRTFYTPEELKPAP